MKPVEGHHEATPRRSTPIQVLVVEPVLPHYRVPLFDGLSRLDDIDLRVAAGRSFPGAPVSVTPAPAWANLDHEITNIGGRLFWQRGIELPSSFGPGDVVVIGANPRILSNIPVMLAARRRGVGVVSWGHGWSPTSRAWRARIRYSYMERADVALVYTEAEVRDLTEHRAWKIPVLAANNALDDARIAMAAATWSKDSLAQFAAREGLANRRLLLFCGRLRFRPTTDLDVAIRALAQLRAERDDYLLVVIGAGEAEQSFKLLARSLGVEDRVRWVGALYREEELAPWFLLADCFVYPGAIGLALLHAFGYGVPVVTNSARRLHGPEIAALRDGENGVLFEKGDPLDLAAKLKALCRDPARIERLRADARRTAQSEFSMSGMIRRFSEAVRLASARARSRLGSRSKDAP